jgi:hypothetical protein
MSDHASTPGTAESGYPDPFLNEESPTMEHPTTASTLTAPPEPEDDPSLDPSETEGDEWAIRGPTHGIRLALPIAGPLAVLLVAAGFWGGAALEKNHGAASTGGGGGFAGRTRGSGGPNGFPFGGGSASAASSGTAGTISVVNGDTLYILSSTGALVKVTLSGSTTIVRNADTTTAGLRPGDTVTVQGATGANGDVAASSIGATAPGVSSTAGGFGLGGGTAATGKPATTGAPTTGGTAPSSGKTTTAGA